MEKVIKTYEPIANMDQAAQAGFTRLVSEVIAGLAEPAAEDDLVALENQRLAVEQQLGRSFSAMTSGCAADCILRPIFKLHDRQANGASLKLFCLPNMPMSHPSLTEQEARCAAAHARAWSALADFVAPPVELEQPQNLEA